jgi:hypothetical protein
MARAYLKSIGPIPRGHGPAARAHLAEDEKAISKKLGQGDGLAPSEERKEADGLFRALSGIELSNCYANSKKFKHY